MDVRLEELLQNSSLLDKLNFTDLLYHQYFDLAEYVLSTRSQIAIVVVYSVAILLSLIGNILVVMVMAKNLSKGTKLRTFLINLAVADLVMAVFCMPFTFTDVMLQQWLFGSVMCPLVRFFQVLSVSVSIFTLVAIGVDRYQAVMYPLRMRMSKSRAKQVVAIIWIMSFALAAVQLAVCRVYQVQSGGTWYQRCEEILWPGHNYRIGYTIVLTCVTYVLPLSILAVTYYKIGVKLWGRHSPSSIYSLEDISERKHERCKRKVKMIIILVGLFAVCWLPIHIFSIVLDFYPDVILSSRQTVMVFFFCSHWLAMSHSFVNPIIYGFLNDSFRILNGCAFAISRGLAGCARHRRRRAPTLDLGGTSPSTGRGTTSPLPGEHGLGSPTSGRQQQHQTNNPWKRAKKVLVSAAYSKSPRPSVRARGHLVEHPVMVHSQCSAMRFLSIRTEGPVELQYETAV
ncbi:NPFFR2 [Branchiostoma lanceolatum]|uniref:NPFFR2 protein n=2 Tax=Branchiostoma TaxID=7737 RepID=A0A8J9Z3D5_BRALA|nr:NPFFR2 [Branchiostoma lanceolatum]